MIVVCDVDNCINDLLAKALDLYNKRNNKDIHVSDITTYNFADCLPQDDADGICELFKEKGLWDSLSPIPGSQNALKTLVKRGHEIYLATSTLPINFPWKVEWIKRRFPFINPNNLICIANKGLLNCDVMIEDNLDNLVSSFSERICLDYLYNRNPSKDFAYSIHRANTWDEIVDIIDDIERKNEEWEK